MSDSRFAEYEVKCARAAALAAEILPHNKKVLFDALTAACVRLVTVEFDGSGDSGQLEVAAAFDAENNRIEIPATEIVVKSVEFDTGTAIEQTTTVTAFIETLAYDLLEQRHDGWENDEGAQGEFKFSTDEKTITLDYNERYTEYHHHEYEF